MNVYTPWPDSWEDGDAASSGGTRSLRGPQRNESAARNVLRSPETGDSTPEASLTAKSGVARLSHGPTLRVLIVSLIGAFLAATGQAEKVVNWQIFGTADGLKDSHVTAVTLSPRGNIWVKHADSDEISVYDGYTVRTLPSPGLETFRIYESRTRQLWSLSTNGLVVYDGHQWIHHSIHEIREEIQTNLLRQVQQIPLIPIQQTRAIFLLSSLLMEYDTARRETTVLKRVTETGLGRFLEMTEARGGGLWITGAKGLAKVTGPLRQISKDSVWEVHLLSESLQVENLQRPFEDDKGGIITVAMDSAVHSKRAILLFDGSTWQKIPVEGEIIRQAWPGWDKTLWAHTINSLLRSQGTTPLLFIREPIWHGQYKDVATETNGVFWLGTSDGLMRCAPFLWRTPADLEGVDSLVHAALEDAEGELWFASTDSLIRFKEGHCKKIKWPENFEAAFQPTDALYPLSHGRIAVAASDRALVFDPRAEQFRVVEHPANRKVRLIGAHKGGGVWAQTSEGQPGSRDSYRLEHFNGDKFVSWIEPPPDWAWSSEFTFAYEAQNGDAWFGGSGGIGVYRNGRWQTFGPGQGFTAGKAFCLLELPDGRLWCGGADKIFEFDGQRWSILRGGFQRVSSMIRSRDGKIWIGTAGGLYSYSKGSWLMNGVEEGLPSAAISKVLEDRHGRIWAGSARGIGLYHPDADVSPPKTLSPRVDYPRKPSTEGPVTLEFNAIDKWRATPAERLLFSYRLDEGPWSSYTNAMVQSLDNLRAGKHRVEVRAMDRNWNEDHSVALAEFSVVIPWYKEPRLLSVLAVGLVLVLFFAGLAVNRHLQLIRSYAEVGKIVALRTHELERANQELLQSQKMKALGTLAAGIAHDFNNILSIIKGSAQIIESHLDDKERIRTRLSRIQTVVEQGSGIVKSMLGLSRVTAQDLVPCDLTAVADDTLKLLGDRFLQEVSIRFQAAPSLPRVPGAKELIQQMLLNLILNGVDAMMGKGEMIVSLGQLSDLPSGFALPPAKASSYVFVAVQDFGCGIAPEVLPRIFEPFFTTKAFSTRRGTGLGLSMVYELAKQMGYGLKVETVVGQGSTFTIFMPGTTSSPPSAQIESN